MNNVNLFLAGLAAVCVVVLGVFLMNPPVVERIVEKVSLGAAAGPEHTEHQFFKSSITDGGAVYSTTTTIATHTFLASELEKYKVLRFLGSATAAAITATLPATSTMTHIIPNPGDTRTWVIENGYTAAATTTTIAAGTGIDLQEPDGQNVVIGINNYAFLTCFREVSTDIVCRVDETIPAD